MKATVNGITVEGTADEIATIIRQFGATLTTSGIGTQPLNTYVPNKTNPIVTTPTPPNTVSSPYGGGLLNGT